MRVLTDIDLIRINGYVVLKSTREEFLGVRKPKVLLHTVNFLKEEEEWIEEHQLIFQKAAILFIHLAKRKIFYTSNVATAWIAMVVFLEINGYKQKFPRMTALYFVNRMAKSTKSFVRIRKDITDFLEKSPHVYNIRER